MVKNTVVCHYSEGELLVYFNDRPKTSAEEPTLEEMEGNNVLVMQWVQWDRHDPPRLAIVHKLVLQNLWFDAWHVIVWPQVMFEYHWIKFILLYVTRVHCSHMMSNTFHYSVAAFSGLSDVHEDSGGLQLTLVPLVKSNQTVTCYTTV